MPFRRWHGRLHFIGAAIDIVCRSCIVCHFIDGMADRISLEPWSIFLIEAELMAIHRFYGQ